MIKENLRLLQFGILCLFLVLFTHETKAAHIVGGDVTYDFVRFNGDSTEVTFRIVFTLYRDEFSGGANFDTDARFGIFQEVTPGNWRLYSEVRGVDPGGISSIPDPDLPCIEPPSTIGVQRGSYVFEITLEVTDRNYMVAYQRCCRNNTIANILEPGETGAVFDVIITPKAQAEGNSSPKFNSFPPIFLCSGLQFEFDHSAQDLEGDVLRYTFCAPFESGGTVDAQTGTLGCCDCVRPLPGQCGPPFDNVIYRPPYTKNAPLAGNPVVSIDNNSGLISGTPEINGQYVVGVCVEEFRDGVIISKIRRDFQFNVLTCTPNLRALLEADDVQTGPNDTEVYLIKSCGDTTVRVINRSTGTDIETYSWSFLEENGDVLFESFGGAENRDVDVTFPGLGSFSGTMILNENSECADTAFFSVSLFPSIDGEYEFAYDTCVAGPVDFTDLTVTGADQVIGWDWDFGDGNNASSQNPNHIYQEPGTKRVVLIAEDNNECKDTVVKDIVYLPVPQLIVVEPTTFVGCLPAEIFFNNLSTPIDSTYEILWDFGDGNTSGDISPTHNFLETGNYSVSVDITSPIGCTVSRSFPDWIRVLDAPVADFTFSPQEPTILNREVSFFDNSTNAGAYQWNFGGVGNSFLQNPTFFFPDSGLYEVLLTTFHPITNCPDTISKRIDVRPFATLFLPNAFTPDNNGTNDEFLGNGYYDGISDYTMEIWNRWGEKIFETDDPTEGWNGQYNNSGQALPQGVYIYHIMYSGPRGEREIKKGQVTLLR
ncbi:MAG: PKD domain-containing protein [Saprospiraceae bacterium]|nr:PKD domain-containing protein [Saprospiraceae bacterium]